MKTILTLSSIIIIILCHGACRTSKLTNRQQARLGLEEQIDFKSQVQEFSRIDRYKSVSDSNGHSYQLTIFPVDTFKFSIQNGFVGRASKVLIEGSGKQLLSVIDSSKFTGSINSEMDGTATKDLTVKTEGRSALVERREGIWKGICVGLIAGVIILGLWRRFWVHDYR